MKLHLEQTVGKNTIVAYEDGCITVNQTKYTQSIIVPFTGPVIELGELRFEQLAIEHFEQLLKLKPELVLLGTGERQRFAHPKLVAALSQTSIGVDCMTTGAACRTFSILVGEDRHCVALLLQ